ncbi:MAG: hypothetical protein EOM53_05180 [Alphaproteobacteria bacterium]|nr:hypothetical protein [Alphaproteobacteria bacterium]NCB50049.1 hypothetical protein [Alphaproteobacteria bacterium]
MPKIDVHVGDFFKKVDNVASKWEVEKIIEYTDIPIHVRLNEHGGNNRTTTVSVTTLQDDNYWIRLSKE